jgi:hypothetical protein
MPICRIQITLAGSSPVLRRRVVNVSTQVVEQPAGIGEIMKAGAHVCKVSYWLEIRKDLNSGNVEVVGEVEVDISQRTLVEVVSMPGKALLLLLDDGRRLEILVKPASGSLLHGRYPVVGANPVGFV